MASWATVEDFEARKARGDHRASVHALSLQTNASAHRSLAEARERTFAQVQALYKVGRPGKLYATLRRSGEERVTYYECRTNDDKDELWAVIGIRQVL